MSTVLRTSSTDSAAASATPSTSWGAGPALAGRRSVCNRPPSAVPARPGRHRHRRGVCRPLAGRGAGEHAPQWM